MVFEDLSQKRWKKARIVFGAIIIMAVILLGSITADLFINPPLPSIQERQNNLKKASNIKANIIAYEKKTAKKSVKKPVSKVSPVISTTSTSTISTSSASVSAPLVQENNMLSSAFLVQDDANSLESFKRHADNIDIVFPDWYFLNSSQCSVLEKEDPDITKTIASSSKASIIPRLTNGYLGKWYGQETSVILHNQETSSCLAGALADMVIKSNVAGINVDLENLKPEDKEAYLEFLKTLGDLLHKNNKLLTVDVTANDPAYDIEYIGQIADYVVLMAYDEHYPSSDPGPIASSDWFADIVDQGVNSVPKNKLIIALGAYGYDWTTGTTTPASSLKFDEVMTLAADADAEPEMNSDSGFNMYFSYKDDANRDHQVWFLNGATAWNENLVAKNNNVAGVALWRLGTEDESYWQIFNKQTTGKDFAQAPKLNSINFENESELFKLKYDSTAGHLQLTTDTDGSIDYAMYDKIPTGYNLDAVGRAFPDKQIALTFDDGPDEIWTPQILKILEDNKVPATFFVVGEQAQKNPDIIKDMAKNGFTFGNHTYLHPDISTISHSRLDLELNQTQRIIETEAGVRTILFRPPYDTDSTPSTPEELKSIALVNQLGYVIAGANIDTEDWQKPGVDAIINNVLTKITDSDNHVIVMHDAGGDRSQTVAALKILIPKLKAEGYTFTSLYKAVGLSHDEINPPLVGSELFFVKVTAIGNFILTWGWIIIFWLFLLTTIIAIFRILFLGTMVLRSAKHYRSRKEKTFTEPVTVIVPCFNEEKTVGHTLTALQNSTKKNIEILVVDDGSTDNTASEVEKYRLNDNRIRLLKKPNGGKSSALNLGFQEAKNNLIVTIDGDTILLPNTIDELTKPFADPKVDAVCGNVEVGNVRNILTGFQALEYITTQNFDRRAFDELNCISVVPGATGAWRRDKILAIGAYGSDTLTEDADLTLRLLASGARIVYAPEARSRTEAPETMSGLAKQRFRWSYGTYQCLYKNRKLFFHGSLGWVALPNMLLFQIIFPILSPIGDLVFILSIFNGNFRAIAVGYLMFTVMDVCGSLLAFTLEKRPKKLMWLILIQRFFYRQFMYVITYKSIIAIIRGKHYGWNKLKRTGNAAPKIES
jgi:cellulose synthase/poly-beta-1,6-N-acetylglucosamine synthase-like glycosyltransferase/spore germination protein YaaH/peptidoglycan/xylan/chitin deacetylase (PgdA/CDA1 family)